jgi:flagellar motor switch protein FliM
MAAEADSIPSPSSASAAASSGSTAAAARSIQPCNFRSAGRLSNESARTLTSLHEASARNIMNSLDVYLGTGLEVKLVRLEQLSLDDYKAALLPGAYIAPWCWRLTRH